MLLLLSLLTAGLCASVLIRGVFAFRSGNREAVTIEEGLTAIRRRLAGRDHLIAALAVSIVAAITAAFALTMTAAAWPADLVMLAWTAVCGPFLLTPLLHRYSMPRILQALEPFGKTQEQDAHLNRMMRTYLYYRNGSQAKPALFETMRRQLALRILGMDPRAYIPLSVRTILRRAALLQGCVAIVALLLMMTGPATPGVADAVPAEAVPDTPEAAILPAPEDPTHAGTGDASDSAGLAFSGNGSPPASPDAPEDRGAPASKRPPETAEEPPMASQDSARTSPSPGQSETGARPPEAGASDLTRASGKAGDRAETGVLGRLLSAIRSLLGAQDQAGQSAGAQAVASRPGKGDGKGNRGAGTAPVRGAAASGQPRPGMAQGGPRSVATAGQSQQADAPPSDDGEGATGQSRISRGSGPKLLGRRSGRSGQLEDNARIMQLDIDQEVRKGKPGETGLTVRPARLNAAYALTPDDVNVTPADPFINQRIPQGYEQTIRKLLTKP